MARVRDKKTGAVVEVADEAIGDALASGNFDLEAGQRVPIRLEGQLRTIPVEDLAAAQQSGAELLSQQGVQQLQREAQFRTTGQQLLGAGEAALRGLTLDEFTGLGTAAGQALGATEEGQAGRREELGDLGTAIELGASVAPVLFSGGAGGVAAGGAAAVRGAGTAARLGRVAGAIPRGVAGVGRGAETLAARGLTAALGEARAGSIAGRAAATATGAAAEGAVLGTAQTLSEAVFQDKEVTAERLMANIGGNALFAAAVGGAGSAAVGATGKAVAAAVPSMQKAAKRFFRASSLEGIANTRAFKQLGSIKRQLDIAKRQFGDDLAPVGRVLKEDGIDVTRSSVGDLADEFARKVDEAGETIGESLKRLDDATDAALKPNLDRIGNRIRKEVITPLKRSTLESSRQLGRRVNNQLRVFTEALDDAGNPVESIGFDFLHRMRRDVDTEAFRNKLNPTPMQQELQKARRIIEDELLTAADKASKSVGGDVANNYRAQKEKFAVYSLLRDTAQDGLTRTQRNNVFGLSDNIFGGGFSGGALGALVAGDVSVMGGLTMAAMAGVAGKVVSRFMNDQGSKLAARVTRSLADIQRRDRATQRALNDAARDYFEGVKRATPILTSMTLQEEFDQTTENLAQFDTNGLELAAHTSFNETPGVADRVVGKLKDAHTFLMEKMPPRNQSDGPANKRGDLPNTPKSQMAKFMRYARVAQDPGVALRDFSAGQLTPEGAEALRMVWPKVWSQLAERARAEMTERKGKLTMQQQIQMTILLGEPVSFSLQQAYITQAQQEHAKKRQPAQPPRRSARVSKQPEQLSTQTQDLNPA